MKSSGLILAVRRLLPFTLILLLGAACQPAAVAPTQSAGAATSNTTVPAAAPAAPSRLTAAVSLSSTASALDTGTSDGRRGAAAAAATGPAASPSVGGRPMAYGVDVNFFDQNLRSEPERLQALAATHALGAGWLRAGLGLGWTDVEPAAGAWNFTPADAFVSAVQAQHLQLLAELGATPAWAAAGTAASADGPPKDPHAFAAYAGAVAQHFRGRIAAYKIYNEPQNMPAWTPAAYAAVFALAAQAIHAADPRALVMPGGFWFAGSHTIEFQNALFADPTYPIGKYLDVYNIHMTRTSPLATQRWLMQAARFLTTQHLATPIWVDEFAYPSDPTVQTIAGYQQGNASQAAYLQTVLPMLVNAPHVDGVFYTYLVDNPLAGNPYERSLGLMRDSFVPKPAYTVYQQFITAHSRPGAAIQTSAAMSSTSLAAPTALPTTYRVAGTQILQANGTPFVPYGVEVPSLWVANWQHNTGMQQNLQRLQQQSLYDTVRTIWHANTIVLKVASADLFDQQPDDQAYLAAIDGVVGKAHRDGMNTIITLQYESTTHQPLPTEDSVYFWTLLAQHYARQPWVFFDIFNEPRNPVGGPDNAAAWALWQRGGAVNATAYVGMQTLVQTIRGQGNHNLIFADGLATGEDLTGVASHLLSGGNVVYAVHPYFNATQHATPQQWDRWFGDAATTLPVTADEWGEYQSSSHGECFPQAPALVPQFLTYLRQKQIGLIGYALYPGILIRGWNFADPTAFDHPPYTCPNTPFPNLDPQAQGAGQLLMQYFATVSLNGR